MIEFKFRAWDRENKEMIGPGDGSFFYEEDNGFHCGYNTIRPTESYGSGDWVNCPVMQWTGLKDCNGVDIYEWDIVSDHVGVGFVEYVDRLAVFRVNYANGRAKFFLDYTLNGERESIEVIGNIYESPELLENKQ